MPDRFAPLRRAACGAALAASAIVLLQVAGAASAALYKWVDANGRVTYSDQPPPANVKAEIVGAPVPPSNPAAVRELASQEADFKKQQMQRADDQKKAAKARADEMQLQQSCADIRAQLRVLVSDKPMLRLNEQGETVYVDDATRLRERERIEAVIRERCSG